MHSNKRLEFVKQGRGWTYFVALEMKTWWRTGALTDRTFYPLCLLVFLFFWSFLICLPVSKSFFFLAFSWEALVLVFVGDEGDGEEDMRLLVELDTPLCFFFFFFYVLSVSSLSSGYFLSLFFSMYVFVFLWSPSVFYFFSYLISLSPTHTLAFIKPKKVVCSCL